MQHVEESIINPFGAIERGTCRKISWIDDCSMDDRKQSELL